MPCANDSWVSHGGGYPTECSACHVPTTHGYLMEGGCPTDCSACHVPTTHGYIMEGGCPTECNACHVPRVKDILECLKYNVQRQTVFGNDNINLKYI